MAFRIEDITYVADVDGKKAIAEARIVGVAIGHEMQKGVSEGTKNIDGDVTGRLRTSFNKLGKSLDRTFSDARLKKVDTFRGKLKDFFQNIGDRASLKGTDSTVRLVLGLIAAAGPAIANLGSAAGAGLLALGDGLGALVLEGGAAALLIAGLNSDLAKTDPATAKAAASMKSFLDQLKKLPGLAAQSAAPNLLKLFDNLQTVLKNVTPGLLRFTDAVANALAKMSAKLGSDAWTTRLNGLFDSAIKLLDPLNNLLLDASAAIIDLFNDSAGPAADFLKYLDQIVTQFDNFLNSKEGRDDVKRWFDNAAVVGKAVADLIGQIAQALDRLTTPQSLKDTVTILGAIGDLADPIARLLDAVGGGVAAALRSFMSSIDPKSVAAFRELLDAMKPLLGQVGKDLGKALADFANALAPLAKQLADFIKANPKEAALAFEAIAAGLAVLAAAPSIAGAVDGIKSMAGAIKILGGALGVGAPGAAGAAAKGGFIGAIIGGIIVQISELSKIIPQFVTDLNSANNAASKGQLFGTQGAGDQQKAASAIGKQQADLLPTILGPTSLILSGFFPGVEQSMQQGLQHLFTTLDLQFGISVGVLGSTISGALSNIPAIFTNTFGLIPSLVSGPLSGLPTLVIGLLAPLVTNAQIAIGVIPGVFTSVFGSLATIVGIGLGAARSVLTTVIGGLGTVVSGALSGIGTIWNGFWSGLGSRVGSLLSGVAGEVRAAINAAISFLNGGIGNINKTLAGIGVKLPTIPKTATGGLFSGSQVRVVGEAGPEAVIPLTQPLSKIDPSVRQMAATLRGQGGSSSVDNSRSRSIVFQEGAVQVSGVSDARRATNLALNGIAVRLAG